MLYVYDWLKEFEIKMMDMYIMFFKGLYMFDVYVCNV